MDDERVMTEPAAVSEPGAAVTHSPPLAPSAGESTPPVAGFGQTAPSPGESTPPVAGFGQTAPSPGESTPAVADSGQKAFSAGEQATAMTQELPVAAEPCAHCSAPLAPDQRYCLQCGAPRAHVSGPMAAPRAGGPTSQLTWPGGGQVPPGAPNAPPGIQPLGPAQMTGRNNTLALLAGIGVLLLAMGVGVLIGRAGAGSSKVPPAQVISVGGSSAGSTTPTTSTPTREAPTAPSPKTKEAVKAKGSAAPGSSITKPAPPSAAKNLRSGKSGQSYEQKSKNLPNVVGT